MKTSTKITLVDNLSNGEINEDSLAADNASTDKMLGGQTKDVVPPFINNLDGRMWNDPLDRTIGNDLLSGEEENEKSLKKLLTKINLAKFLTFATYSETTNLN
ncbi:MULTISPECIES: hypothetical protein [unclassified Microcoleus]|uniref:hypothetical protein n=1 Tax=unclassified Microcoleus TaxID=2642155 RepID=UPI002FD0ADFA